MDQFEQARQRNEKRLERMARTQANQQEKVVFIEPPKEKPAAVSDALIEVKVRLPDGAIVFTLVKSSVYQNVNRVKLNKNALLNCVRDGLRPIFGETKEL